jgi:uncharacterized protein YkwD
VDRANLIGKGFGNPDRKDPVILVEDDVLSRAAQLVAEPMAEEQTERPIPAKTREVYRSKSNFKKEVVLYGAELRWPPFSPFGRANKPEAANAAKVIQKWMSNPEDRKSILNPRFTEIGVGVAYSARGVPYYALILDVDKFSR